MPRQIINYIRSGVLSLDLMMIIARICCYNKQTCIHQDNSKVFPVLHRNEPSLKWKIRHWTCYTFPLVVLCFQQGSAWSGSTKWIRILAKIWSGCWIHLPWAYISCMYWTFLCSSRCLYKVCSLYFCMPVFSGHPKTSLTLLLCLPHLLSFFAGIIGSHRWLVSRLACLKYFSWFYINLLQIFND